LTDSTPTGDLVELLAEADCYDGSSWSESLVSRLAAALRRERDDLIRVGMFAYPEEAERSVAYNGDPARFPWPDPRFPDAIPIFVKRSDLPASGPVSPGEDTPT
jgi:hypothetical protein